MNEGILIPLSLFLAIFGIFYLYLSTRNRERLALIEKGANASIFNQSGKSFQKIIVLNLSFLLMGIGVGTFTGLLLATYTALDENALYPASIFTFAGLGLFLGCKITKDIDK
ncbi:DUF6249 domain-containing protein [Flavobacterium sp. TBRC 19031]|uniref:DUF6249 domain-containing protein n=1 Tax=Flavobacterium mekongense TaxID=3379707 RepID=UPI00399C1209